ncbi:MAG: acyl-CoA dehydrogenase family protein [Patescibacteria group bacterium]
MDFNLTDEQKALQEMAKNFAKRHFAPIVNEYEEKEKHPMHLFKEMADAGFLGANVPEEHGGMGLDSVSQMLITKELAKVWAAGDLSLFIVPNSLVVHPIVKYGTPKQIEKYLKPSIEGKKFGCFCLTEPDFGSYVKGIKTSADWVANSAVGYNFNIKGDKAFITNVTFADFAIVLARLKSRPVWPPSIQGGDFAAFIVDLKDNPAVEIIQKKKRGLHSAPFGEIHFENTPVSIYNALGPVGKGYEIFMDTLQSGRVFIAAQAWGVAEAAFEDALAYAKEREAFEKPIISHQAMGHMLADMAIALKEAEFWTMYAATLRDSGSPDFRKWASAAKIRTTEIATDLAHKNILIHGGSGYLREIRAGRLLNDSLAFEIYEGTNPIQRNIIASELKK